MTDRPRAIFRESAVQHHALGRVQAALPRLRRPPTWFGWGRRTRVPVMLQLSAVECGAACLAMILNYHGRRTSLVECRSACGIGRDGVTTLGLVEAARRFGLRARALSVETTDFPHVPLPAIAHWNFDHFVVIEHWSPTEVVIVDPASGRRRVTPAEFDAAFTGVVLVLEPRTDFQRGGTAGPSAARKYFAAALAVPGCRTLLLQVLAASLLLQVLGLAVPLVIRGLVDSVLPWRGAELLLFLGVGIVLAVLAQMGTTYLRATLLSHLQARLDARLMPGFFQHLLALPYSFFQQRTTGDLLMRLTSNETIRNTLTQQTLSLVLDGGLAVGYLAALFYADAVFGAAALGLGLLQVLLVLGSRRRALDLVQRHLAASAQSQSYVVEALKGMATLKASGGEDQALEHWSNLFFKELNLSMRRNELDARVETVLRPLNVLAPLLLLWVGAYEMLAAGMSLGAMLALNALAVAFLSPLASLVANGQRLRLVGCYLERLTDVLDAEPEQNPQAARRAPRLTGRIDVRGVHFRYSGNAPWVLKDIALRVEPGQKIALVGRSGSGKSTLGMLFLGLCTPTEGEVCYDGVPLARLDCRGLRRQFGVVLQEPFLFAGSIRQNIAFHKPALSLNEVREAAVLAGIHEEILAMPMGYETLVAEGGGGLSGGQRQRLALARALAHRPALLLLDEATSNLDVLSERLVDRNLTALRCTRIVIAHRLSTIRNADRILVVEQGTIVEQGSHEELSARGGLYATLISQQIEDAPPAGCSTTAGVSPSL